MARFGKASGSGEKPSILPKGPVMRRPQAAITSPPDKCLETAMTNNNCGRPSTASHPRRRTLEKLATGLAAATAGLATSLLPTLAAAQAQDADYPSRVIRFVVPY